MTSIPFTTASMASKGELIVQFPDEEHDAPIPDLQLGNAEDLDYPDWTKDRYGQTRKGKRLKSKGRFLYKLHDVIVTYDPPALRILLWQGVGAAEQWNSKMNPEQIKVYKPELHETRPAVYALHDWNSNYYHCTIDIEPIHWARPWLEGKAEVYAHCVKTPILYDTLYFPSFWPPDGFAPGPIHWLRDTYGVTREKSVDVLYLSRNSDTNRRRVVNETEVLQTIGKFGLSVLPVECGKLTIPEQIEAAASARFIIGPHGAAMTNAIYANDAAVIEFLPERYQPPYFTYFSKWAGNRAMRIVCPHGKNDDMVVNLDFLATALEQALG